MDWEEQVSGKPNAEGIKLLWAAVQTLNDSQAHLRSIAQRLKDLSDEQAKANDTAIKTRDVISKVLEDMDIRPGSGNYGVGERTIAFLQITHELFQQDYTVGMAAARSGEYRPSSLDTRGYLQKPADSCNHDTHVEGCPACEAAKAAYRA